MEECVNEKERNGEEIKNEFITMGSPVYGLHPHASF
jgi:predicted nuclease with RNAse H fold